MHWQKKLAVAGQTEGGKDDEKYDRNRWCLNASVVLLQGIEEKKKSENELFDTKKKGERNTSRELLMPSIVYAM